MLMLGMDIITVTGPMDTTDLMDTGVTGERSKHNSTNNETVLHKIIFLDST